MRLQRAVERAREYADHACILVQTIEQIDGPLVPPRERVPFADRTRTDTRRHDWRELIVNELAARDGTNCYLCHHELPGDDYHIDHIIPRSLGGDHTLANVALACGYCNSLKACNIVAFTITSERPWYSHAAQANADPDEADPEKLPARPLR